MEEMKKEVLQLQKDLLQEKAKVKSLKTELENPLNVHRWRKLEGNDPSTLELINKIQSLQRRLIARKEDLVDRELSLQEPILSNSFSAEKFRTDLHIRMLDKIRVAIFSWLNIPKQVICKYQISAKLIRVS
jgi:hypothetical protein